MLFEDALPFLKRGRKLKRSHWKDIYIELEVNTEHTTPYIVMQRREERFVMEISTDSLLADDWEAMG